MILTCKQVARELRKRKLRDFSPLKRWWIKLHIKYCSVCGEYQRDAVKFQEAEANFADKEKYSAKLDDNMKERLRQRMKECASKD